VISLFCAALACTSFALSAEAQQGGAGVQVAAITDAQMANIDGSVRVQIRAIADSARRSGLPFEKILDKAREYTTKRRPGSLVLSASRELLGNLVVAQGHLGAGASAEDIGAAAIALKVGVDPATLVRIRAVRTDEPSFVSFSVMSDLTEMGVPLDSAERLVTLMTVAGVRNAHLDEYRAAVQNDIALGALPAAAASTRAEATILSRAARPLDGIRNPLGGFTNNRRPPPPLTPRKP
jgi:hypothetical protein